MRIGIVIDEFDRPRGGMSEWCCQFVSSIAKLGHSIHVVARRIGDVPDIPNLARHFIANTNSRLDFADAAARQLRELNLDIVHDMGAGWDCNVFQPHTGSLASILNRKLDTYAPWIRALKRPIDPFLPRRRDFIRLWKKQYDTSKNPERMFLALSNTVADDFVSFHGVRPEQITVVYNGVDCDKFSPKHRELQRECVRRQLGVEDNTILLLFAAHNFRLKGLPELLGVAGRLVKNQRPVHVAIIGGKRWSAWRKRAARHGLQNRASFVGPVPDLVPYYAAADVFVHPTYYDPCSLVLLEAAASGLPIVTTRRHNGAAELFREGQEMLKVSDPSDADGLYECVDALFEERLRMALGAAARHVALRHSFQSNVAEILDLYARAEPRRRVA